MNSLHVKKGDNVLILAGKDKGKKGTVISASPKDNTVRVEGINVITKHVKPRGAQQPGGISKEPGNVHVSNVQVICPDCGKPTRVAHAALDGKKTRVCKHCGASLDKAGKAAAKKEKKTAKRTKKEAAPETTEDVKTTAAAEEAPKKKPARKTAKKTETAEKAE